MPAILPETPQVEVAIVEMTNAFRAKNNLQTVSPDPKLTKAARSYAAYLAKTDTFSHTADGREVGDRITSAGYTWCKVGENLAMHMDSRGFESRALAGKSVQGWINSPGHRQNMLAPHVTEIGVGVAKVAGKDPKFISVQLFARPQSLAYEFQISNTSKQTVSYRFDGESHEVQPSYAVTHTACTPGELVFDKAGGRKLSMRYQTSDGLVFVLKPDQVTGLRVDVEPLQKISGQ
jgi:hypothetical protein